VAFSPNGKLLAGGSADGTIRLWDVVSRQPLVQPLTGNTGMVLSVAFSPDGRLLASGGVDNTVRLLASPMTWVDQACQEVGRNLDQSEWNLLIGKVKSYPYRRDCAQFPSGRGAPLGARAVQYPVWARATKKAG
jgi:hypothetical protein